jgi:Arc/MetJ-type ribon-helix-helix transcriptional regulator
MNISLAPELEKAVGEKIRRGQYPSANALVHEAVERLVEADAEEHAHRNEIRRRIAVSDAEIDRGEFTEYDERTLADLPRQVRERGMKRLAVAGQAQSRKR